MRTPLFFFFFFQAEDGIRDKLVTGVQTCALPISVPSGAPRAASPNAVVCVDSTTERRTTGAGLAVIDPAQARRELLQERFVGGEPLALARDDLGRGALDELRARELPLAELDALFDPLDLL